MPAPPSEPRSQLFSPEMTPDEVNDWIHQEYKPLDAWILPGVSGQLMLDVLEQPSDFKSLFDDDTP